MLMFRSQLFYLMRREINNQQTPARLQHARCFCNHCCGFIGKVQHLMHEHEIV